MSAPNLPKLPDLIPPAVINAVIEAEIEPLKARAAELIEDCNAFIADHPTIENDDDDATAAEVLATVQRFTSKSGRVETVRVALKAPVLAADTAIGSMAKGPFAGVIVSVEAVAQKITRASTNYKVTKDARARAEREAAARAEREAARKAEEAAVAGRATYEDAAQAAEVAEKAEEAASAKPAELTRVHGENAGTSSLRWKRTFQIEAPHLVPRHLCVPNEALIRASLAPASPTHDETWIALPDGKWGRRDIVPGCLVIDEPDLIVRK